MRMQVKVINNQWATTPYTQQCERAKTKQGTSWHQLQTNTTTERPQIKEALKAWQLDKRGPRGEGPHCQAKSLEIYWPSSSIVMASFMSVASPQCFMYLGMSTSIKTPTSMLAWTGSTRWKTQCDSLEPKSHHFWTWPIVFGRQSFLERQNTDGQCLQRVVLKKINRLLAGNLTLSSVERK